MHHFSRTDGLFAGNKSFETVQMLCGQCFGDCHKQQPYVVAVAIFKIAFIKNDILDNKAGDISFQDPIYAYWLKSEYFAT